MAAKPSPTMLRRQLGAELRRIRDRAQRTVASVADQVGWSESKLSRIETANTGVRNADLDRLLTAYGVDDAERTRLRALAAQSRQRAWWEAYGDALPDAYETFIGFEAEATSIRTYEAQVVPGLLQTAEYASAVMHAFVPSDRSEVIEQRVAVRMARQAVLTRQPPPQLWAILDEDVLRRPVGGPDVLRRQLLRLIQASEQSMVTIQILPFSVGAHPGLAGSFMVLEFAGSGAGSGAGTSAGVSDQPLVYSEGLTGGVFRSKPDDLRSYLDSFEALRAAAMTPVESMEAIAAAARGES
ncbi:helix-turn-helix domain-containing protein [Rugosimonospora africana]|uniref:helix-turn-helix domain-containing protein n=1 Tax=Rugosimonospora africana TaxID=556532 RepID=UPI001942D37A|nr:helix-turn-helix transcriptional regulator [Rugosimonospora africana]